MPAPTNPGDECDRVEPGLDPATWADAPQGPYAWVGTTAADLEERRALSRFLRWRLLRMRREGR